MFRGLLTGLFVGAVCGVAALAVVSLLLPSPSGTVAPSGAEQRVGEPLPETPSPKPAPAPLAAPEPVTDAAPNVEQAQSAPAPQPPVPQAGIVEVPAGSQFGRGRDDTQPVAPDTEESAPDLATAAPTAPPVSEPEPDLPEVEPAAAPAVGAGPEAPDAPASTLPAPAAPQVDAPIAVPDQAAAPQAPAVPAAPDLGMAVEPADITALDNNDAPDVSVQLGPVPKAQEDAEATPLVPEPSDAPNSIVVVAPEGPAPAPAPPQVSAAPAAPIVVTTNPTAAPVAAPVADTTPTLDDAPAPAPLTDLALPSGGGSITAPQTETAPRAETRTTQLADVPRTLNLPQIGTAPAVDEDVAGESPAASAVPDVGVTPPALPSISAAPQPGFGQDPGVRSNRLPQAGAPTAEPEPFQPAAAEGALANFAADFSAASPSDLLGLVLFDVTDPAERMSIAELLATGLPVSVAVDPLTANASERAAELRAAGFEVGLLTSSLPHGARPADLAVNFNAWTEAVPEAALIVEAPEVTFQNSRGLSQHVIGLAQDGGYGLITHDIGLNTADQLAEGAGLLRAESYRLIDGGKETAAVIRRTLDRAAFEATRSGAILIAGTARPETLNAIKSWLQQSRRDLLAAPASAVLRP